MNQTISVKDKPMQLKELRKIIKPLGFKVKTQTFTWGRHATYIHTESGEELTCNVYTDEQQKRWKPLHEALKDVTKVYDGDSRIYGGTLNV